MTEQTPTADAKLTARGRASRDAIVRAATGLMLQRGVAATGVDDVLEVAGASKSQLYHYFTNKRDLVTAVIDHAERTVLDAQEPHLSSLDTWESLSAWCDHIVALKETHGCELGCPLGTLAAELVATDEAARVQLDHALHTWEARLIAGLARMQERQLLDSGADIDALATATMASLQGGLLLSKTSRSTRPLRIALDAALAHLRTAANPARPRSAPRSRAR